MKCGLQQSLYSIAGFVLTTYFSSRYNFGVARQESNPQSATKHSSNVTSNTKGQCNLTQTNIKQINRN